MNGGTEGVTTPAVLRLDGLHVDYPGTRGTAPVAAVIDLSFTIPRGQTVAIVGESGSGKSTTLHALLGLTDRRAAVRYDRLQLRDADGALRDVDDPQQLRGRTAGLVPQDPVRALDPLVRIENHFRELHRHFLHLNDRDESRQRTIAGLEAVGIDRAELRLRQYPHELSGGLRQRILIALALVGEPRLLLADEPTSNLDTTVQRRVLDLFDELREERDLSILLVTHDIAVAAERSAQIIVMRAGRVVEAGPTDRVIAEPTDPYTRRLLHALPSRIAPRSPRPITVEDIPVLEARHLTRTFSAGRGKKRILAVDDLSLTLHRGRTIALVGESGAGKSTALRLLTGLDAPDRGEVRIDGLPTTRRRSPGALVGRVQLVYQNPSRSVNPSLTVAQAIAEPLEAARIGDRASRLRRVQELLSNVELSTDLARRRPHELSGGQLQRVAIARALAPDPEIVVLDEPVSALDQSVQFALLTLLTDLQARLGLSYVLVSHDLSVVRAVADEVLVLHRGRVVDQGPTETIFTSPSSPHTRALLDAVPSLQLPEPSRIEMESATP